jgi:hypothetical protein
MTDTPAPSPLSTFVIRFWREWSAAGPQWRGRIEHVQSGESAPFLSWRQMVDFIQRFGIMAETRDPDSGP